MRDGVYLGIIVVVTAALVVAATFAGFLSYVAAGAIGALVGIGELVARYRDAPVRALKTLPAHVYVGLNVCAAAGALFLIEAFDLTLGSQLKGTTLTIVRVLASGFGAMAVFRSSVFTGRIGDQDVPLGPQAFLQVVLAAADRAVDRLRAIDRAAGVVHAMAGVSFNKAYQALPTFCLALMQNLPREDQAALGRQVTALQASTMDELTKSLVLGLALMNAVGENVLLNAIEAARIKNAAAVSVTPLENSIKVGGTLPLRAEARDAKGGLLTGIDVQWRSSDSDICTVDASGNVTALKVGLVAITATADGVSGSCSVKVA
jgi:hypothetical protein